MTDIAELGYRVDTSGLVKGKKALDNMEKSGAKLEKRNKSLSISKAKVKTAIGVVTAAATGAIFQFKNYGKALAEVNTLLDSSWDTGSLDVMNKEVRKLTMQMGGNLLDNTKALYQVISAGASNSAEAIETLTAANKLAIGGVSSVTVAVDGLTSATNAYAASGLTSAEASDSLFIAVKKGKTTIDELSGVMGKVAPIASQMGVEFDDLNAALATMTTTGTSTSEAATGIAGALKAVIQPKKDALAVAKELGIQFDVAGLKTKGFAGFIADIAKKTGGSTEQLGRLFGDIEGLKSVMQLGGEQAGTYAEILEAMGEKAGATDEAFDKMTSGTALLSFNLGRLLSYGIDTAIVIGEALSPSVNFFVNELLGTQKPIESTNRWLLLLIDKFRMMVKFVKLSIQGYILMAKKLFDLSSILRNHLVKSFDDFNAVVRTNIDIFNVLEGVFKDTEVVGISLIEGLLVGWERVKGSVEVAAISIKGAFGRAFDSVRREFAELIDSIATGLDKTKIFGRIGSDVKKFADKIRGAQSAFGDYESAVEDSKEETERAIKAIRIITSDMVDYERETKKVTAATKEAAKQTKILDEVIDDSSETINSTAAPAYINFNEDLKKLIGQYNTAIDAVGEYSDQTEKTTGIMADAWERFKDSAFTSLQTFWRSGLDGTKSFSESIKNLFKDMIAGILAQITALIASNVFKKFLEFLNPNSTTSTGIFDDVLSSITGSGGKSGGGGISAGNVISAAGGIGKAASAVSGIQVTAGATLGDLAIAGVGKVVGGVKAAGAAISAAYGSVTTALAAIPGWGWAAAAALAAAAAIFGGGGRSPFELGTDQLNAVNRALEEGRTAAVDLGDSLTFRGGFDEFSYFFDIAGKTKNELQEIGKAYQRITGADQALALNNTTLRIEDFSRKFSESNALVIDQLRQAIAEVENGAIQAAGGVQRAFSGSLSGIIIDFDGLRRNLEREINVKVNTQTNQQAPSRAEQQNTNNLQTLTNIAIGNSIQNQPLFGT